MAKKMDKNTLLVAVDFTPFSEMALVFASELAEKLEAQLLVLHVIHDPAEAPGFYAQKGKKKKFLQSMEEAAEEMMEEFLAKMHKDHPDEASAACRVAGRNGEPSTVPDEGALRSPQDAPQRPPSHPTCGLSALRLSLVSFLSIRV